MSGLREAKCEGALINQFLRSGTSIGANVREAFYAQGMMRNGCYGQIVRIFFSEMIFWVPTRFIQNDIKASASYLDKLAEKKQMKYMQKAASAD